MMSPLVSFWRLLPLLCVCMSVKLLVLLRDTTGGTL
jgi:hypothetical protein